MLVDLLILIGGMFVAFWILVAICTLFLLLFPQFAGDDDWTISQRPAVPADRSAVRVHDGPSARDPAPKYLEGSRTSRPLLEAGDGQREAPTPGGRRLLPP